MKKIYILSFLLAALTACNDLDQEPKSSITTSQLYRTESDAIAGVTGVYASLTNWSDQPLYGRNMYFLTDMASDYAAAGASAINANVRAISSISYNANNDRISLVWEQIYRGINRANVAIDNIPKVQASDDIKKRLINEAKFIRALLYFNAVQLWGPVPLILHEPESNNDLKSSRAEVDLIYSRIIEDLTDAQELPDSYSANDLGRATGGAAKALLAKVYLVRKDWRNAQIKAAEVINGPYGYALFENYGDISAIATKNGKEHIFSAQFEDGQQGTIGRSGNQLASASFIGFNAIEPADIISDTRLFYDEAYEPGDLRKDATYAQTLVNPANGRPFTYAKPLFIKYLEWSFVEQGLSRTAAGVNFPVIRYADVLLVYAEALNEENHGPDPAGQAYWAINQVRRRAFGDPLNAPSTHDLSGLNETSFREAIQKERLLEFVQEGQRWFDLVRWGILIESLQKVPAKAGVTSRNYLFPIPQDQRDLNPDGLWQNEGY
ncbi:RagB/SusD family nutrient uptake outer membrane protein [Viscerimonas tarda]